MERDRFSAVFRSIVPTLLWLTIAAALILLLPDRAWRFRYYGLIALGAIGIWRYTWQLVNACRSYYYGAVWFPRLREQAALYADRPPKRIYVVVASYHESYQIDYLCFTSLIREARGLGSEVTVVASVGSEEEAQRIQDIVEQCQGHEEVRLIFTLQENGKRLALAYALRVVAREFNRLSSWHSDAHNDLVILMDGDTAIAPYGIKNCLPYFRMTPDLGAATTDEIAHVLGKSTAAVRSWYDLKLVKRHHLMQSHGLSMQLLTLTGRFSIFRAGIATSEEFIEALDRDHLTHWLYGTVRFLMGDDKSTVYCVMKNGWKTLYVPDAKVYALEDRSNEFFKLTNLLMLRWYGNMLRNSRRSIALGVERLPFFTWLSLLDQRISVWTPLIGPVAAILLSLTVSGYCLWFYAIWIILTRLAQLWMVVLHGHPLQFRDLFLVIWEQWYGSLVKVYLSCNLHRQVWQKARSEAQVIETLGSFRRLREGLSTAMVVIYAALFVIAVGFISGAFRFPRVF